MHEKIFRQTFKSSFWPKVSTYFSNILVLMFMSNSGLKLGSIKYVSVKEKYLMVTPNIVHLITPPPPPIT